MWVWSISKQDKLLVSFLLACFVPESTRTGTVTTAYNSAFVARTGYPMMNGNRIALAFPTSTYVAIFYSFYIGSIGSRTTTAPGSKAYSNVSSIYDGA